MARWLWLLVVGYCQIQCGEVATPTLNIQINPRLVHQLNHHIQMVVGFIFSIIKAMPSFFHYGLYLRRLV